MLRQLTRSLQRRIRRQRNLRWIALEAALGIRIYTFSLFEKALRHPSAENDPEHGQLRSYERLEFLGDAILGAVIAEYLYREFPEEMEGFLTSMRSKLVSGEACAHIARDLGLSKFVEMAPHLKSRGAHENTSVLADCLESVIGAIHLDSGMPAARRFISQHILARADLTELVAIDENYKSRLQEYVQARGWPKPEYRLAATDGPPHNAIFTLDVYVDGKRRGRGMAGSKKKATQHAARQALSALQIDE